MKIHKRQLSEFIEECTERNSEAAYGVDQLLGVNSKQEFCETRANTTGIDFRPYKVVRKDNFVYNPARLDIGSIARYEGDVCIVSTLYEVFRIRADKLNELLPEFLQIFFARAEFARYVGFANWGSAREYFWLDAMKRVALPIPPVETQRNVVDIYRSLVEIKRAGDEAESMLQELCPALFQYSIHGGV